MNIVLEEKFLTRENNVIEESSISENRGYDPLDHRNKK
jgi:hypothetical protein